jgi:WD40 repeat protein
MSHDGRWLLSIDKRCLPYVHLSDLTTGTRVRTFTAPNELTVLSCAISHSHLFIVGGTVTGNIYLWNTNSGALVKTLSGHKDTVYCLCVFLNDTRIVSGSHDNTVRIWSIEHTPGICLHILEGHTQLVITCFVSADDTRIFSLSDDDTVRVWDSQTSDCIRTHPSHYGSASCVLSDDNQCYATVKPNDGRKIKLWNINTGECQQTITNLDQSYSSIFYLSEDRLVLGDYRDVCVWNLETNKAFEKKRR